MPPLSADLVLRAARPRAAPTGTFKERVSPSAHPARLAYPRREMPPPGYHRRTQGLSPSRRLDGHPCVPGLFHPGRAHGVLPSRAFSLRGAVTPLGARCPPDLRHALSAPSRSPTRTPTSVVRSRSPGPRDPGGQAPGGADPAAARRASETRCSPTTRCRVDPAVLPWRRGVLTQALAVPVTERRRGWPSRPCSPRRARSPRCGCLGRAGAVALLGFLLSRAHWRRRRGSAFRGRPPLSGLTGLARDQGRGFDRLPPRGLPARRLGGSLARSTGPLEVSHLLNERPCLEAAPSRDTAAG